MGDGPHAFPLTSVDPPVFPFKTEPAPSLFEKRALLEEELDRAADASQRRTSGSRGTDDYGIRLVATRVAHKARSWAELVVQIRQQFSSHLVGDREDARVLIDTATAAFGQERGASDDAWYYGLALQKEYDERVAAERRERIEARVRQIEADPELQRQLELDEQLRRQRQAWEDRARRLSEETGVELAYARAFLIEFERLSMPRHPGVIDPRGIPFIQAQVPLYASAYLIKTFILPFTPVGPLLGGYEAVTGRDFLSNERLSTWERVLGAVQALLPFAGGAVKGGIKAGVGASKSALAAISHSAKGMAALAKELGLSARAMLRFTARLARLPAAKVRALLARVESARRGGQGLKLLQSELRLAGQVDDAIRSLEAGAAPASRTASGLIDGGRALSRTQSGTIVPPAAAKAAAGAAKPLSKAAQSLVSAGYSSLAIRALEELGVKVTAKLAARLKALGDTGRDFLNLFYQSKGFHRVVRELGRSPSKQIGAEFVIRFATQHPDILVKVRHNPLLVAFEWGAGIKKTRRFGDIFAREVDIVVRGDATLGIGETVYHELKSWTANTLRAAKGRKLPQQFVRDSALLDPHNIRWVFNSAKTADRGKIIEVFVQVIQKDAYLSAKWGTDTKAIVAALEKVVVTFP